MNHVSPYERLKKKPLNPLMQQIYNAYIESGLTQTEIEDRSGIGKESLKNWFTRGVNGSLVSVCAVVESLNLEIKVE